MCFNYNCIKDFLEIVYYISGALVPIILIFVTIKFSKKANLIALNTLKIQELQVNFRPAFNFEYEKNENNERVKELLIISNKNDTVLEECSVDYDIYLTLKPNGLNQAPVSRKVMHYYFSISGSLGLYGSVKFAPAPNEDNRFAFSKLYREIINAEMGAYLTLERVIHISYTDEKGDNKKNSYLLNEFGFKKIESYIPKNCIDNHDSIYKLSAQQLINDFNAINKPK